MDNPWAGIDPALLTSDTLTLADLDRYWTVPQGEPGRAAPCCNCSRTLRIEDHGLCGECRALAGDKTGSDLLNALTIFRALVIPVEPVPTGAIGDAGEDFERPRVVGKVEVPPPAKRGPGRPRKVAAPKAPAPKSAPLRVCDEDGRDLGTLRALADRMLAEEEAAGATEPPAPAADDPPRTSPPAGPRIRRARVIEVDRAEVEFRCGQTGLDILVRDDEGVVFATFDLPVAIVNELHALGRGEC